jgi:hypothetical protein
MKIELPSSLEKRIKILEEHIERLDKTIELIIKELDNEL